MVVSWKQIYNVPKRGVSLTVNGKVTFITGAGSGIGYQLGEQFAESGAIVVFSDVNEKKLDEISDKLSSLNCDFMTIQCDVTKESDLISAINQTIDKYNRVDIFINNAGMQHVAPIEDFSTEKFRYITELMLVGPFIALKHVFPIMKKQKYGRIINIASINGVIGFAGKAAYNSAKHGVIGLTKVASLESAEYGITVNALCPGYVDTPLIQNQMENLAHTRKVSKDKVIEEVLFPLIPQKRLLQVQEVADYALFLASDKAKGVTGQAVMLDGGYTAQ